MPPRTKKKSAFPEPKQRTTRLPSLLKKPVIEVRGQIGKIPKSKKRKVKGVYSSSVDFYEDRVDSDKKKIR